MYPSPETNEMVKHDRRTSGGNWLHKSQAGPVRLHLLGERSIFILTLYVNGVLLLGKDLLVLRRIKQKLMSRFSITDMGDVSLVLRMGVTRDSEKATVTITQQKYAKSLLERYGMASCNSTYTSGVGKEPSLDQPEERFLSKEEKQRFQASRAA